MFEGSEEWRDIETSESSLYNWDDRSPTCRSRRSSWVSRPSPSRCRTIHGARCLAKVGDSVTTDHICPAGAIKTDSPAGQYLKDHGVARSMFNSYGSRRGNDAS